MHESKENLSNEQEVKQAIEDMFHVKLNKLPISYRMDFMAFRDDKPTSVIEVKCRKAAASTTYPCFMLALGKWNSGIDYTIKNNIRFFLVGKYSKVVTEPAAFVCDIMFPRLSYSIPSVVLSG